MRFKQEYILGENWSFLIILFCLSLLAYVRFKHPAKMQRLYDAILNSRMVKQLMREESLLGNRASVFLALNFWLMLGLFLFFAIKLFFDSFFVQYEINLYWLILLALFAAYFVKTIFLSFGETLFDRNYGFTEYLRNVFIFNNTVGIILIPLNLLLALLPISRAPIVIYAAGVFVFSIFLFRLYRGALIGIEHHAQTQYLFLYLCALEILPIAVIIARTSAIII